MPRFEPSVNQPAFIVPEDPYAIAAAPPILNRSSSYNTAPKPSHKKKNSLSALERLSVFAEVTQRVKRRVRCAIAGAVGASAPRPKRRSRDAMNVDYVWNGYFDTTEFPVGPVYQEPEPVSRLPNYAPVVNRYSVNMEERSISEFSMYDGVNDSAPTPRANTPEVSTPATTKSAKPKDKKAKKSAKPKDEDEDDASDADEEDSDGEEEARKRSRSSTPKTAVKAKKEDSQATAKPSDDAASIRSPMDEDPREVLATPKQSPATHSVPLIKTPKPKKRRGTVSSIASTDTVTSTPKASKATLHKEEIAAKQNSSHPYAVTSNEVPEDPAAINLGLDLELGTRMLRELDLMDIFPPSAAPHDVAPPYAEPVSAKADAPLRKPILLPPVELTEKPIQRKSSRDSETTVVGSPKEATLFNEKKAIQESPQEADFLKTALGWGAKIDSLPAEEDDRMPHSPAFRIWPASPSPLSARGLGYAALPFQTLRRQFGA